MNDGRFSQFQSPLTVSENRVRSSVVLLDRIEVLLSNWWYINGEVTQNKSSVQVLRSFGTTSTLLNSQLSLFSKDQLVENDSVVY